MFGLLLFVQAGAAVAVEPWNEWRGKSASPLPGKIWSRADNGFVAPEELVAAARRADILLLGEYHDNPDHHRLQAWLLAQYAAAKKPGVVFEMLRAEQEEALNAYLARPDATAEGLGAAVGWEERGWPDWAIYRPIAEAAFKAGLEIYAGDASREAMRDASRQHLKPLPDEALASLALDTPFPDDLASALLSELFTSHCKMAPAERLKPMADVQRFRDASFAHRLRFAATAAGGSAVLIAGNGHVRDDRGVPWFLARQGAGAPLAIATIMMVEAGDGAADPASLLPKDPQGRPAADFFWFTPGVERGDPCEQFKLPGSQKP